MSQPGLEQVLLHRGRQGDRRVVRRAGRVDELIGDGTRQVDGDGARLAGEVSLDRLPAAARENSGDDRDDHRHSTGHDGRLQGLARVQARYAASPVRIAAVSTARASPAAARRLITKPCPPVGPGKATPAPRRTATTARPPSTHNVSPYLLAELRRVSTLRWRPASPARDRGCAGGSAAGRREPSNPGCHVSSRRARSSQPIPSGTNASASAPVVTIAAVNALLPITEDHSRHCCYSDRAPSLL